MSCESSSVGLGVEYPLELADVLPVQFISEEEASSESEDLERSVHISISTSRYIANEIDGVRVRIDADDAVDMPTKVFAYLTLPLDPKTGERSAVFSHVCSPADLEEYPANTPLPGITPEWLRLDYVDVIVRSWDEATDLITTVKSDLKALCATLNIMDTVSPLEAVWVTE